MLVEIEKNRRNRKEGGKRPVEKSSGLDRNLKYLLILKEKNKNRKKNHLIIATLAKWHNMNFYCA